MGSGASVWVLNGAIFSSGPCLDGMGDCEAAGESLPTPLPPPSGHIIGLNQRPSGTRTDLSFEGGTPTPKVEGEERLPSIAGCVPGPRRERLEPERASPSQSSRAMIIAAAANPVWW
jgi:hypothetical protein